MITYVDADGDTVEVIDNSDLKLALSGINKIVFQVAPFADANKPVQMQAQPSQPVVEEVIQTNTEPVVEEVIDTTSKLTGQAVGKKPKKNGGMNRKAMKNLI